MTTQTEALKLTEKLAYYGEANGSGMEDNPTKRCMREAATLLVRLTEALAQQSNEQVEPVAWNDENVIAYCLKRGIEAAKNVTPQRKPQLTVRIRSYPESNGKRNWTAMFVRTEPFDGLVGNSGGVTIDRGECWNRVAYNAERARFLLGERTTEPSILEYGKDVKTPEEWEGKDSEAAHNIKE